MKPALKLGPETMDLPFSAGLTTRSSGFAPCAANNLIFFGWRHMGQNTPNHYSGWVDLL